MDPENYCRELEAYLCRKNDGHLIRIVGPAFERVSDWARQGIPVKVACDGIDRYFERYYRRGPRRRPVRIEFCEADVLDVFDAWRRAVGVVDEGESAPRARSSLAAHVERAIARLTALRASAQRTESFDAILDEIVRALDGLQPRARSARGHVRDQLLDELAGLDRHLIDNVLGAVPLTLRDAARAAAHEQLAPFRDRMAREAYDRACAAAAERYVREQLGLPSVAFE
jgi:phage terminase Nu1 subunit (DNA packaging protein)